MFCGFHRVQQDARAFGEERLFFPQHRQPLLDAQSVDDRAGSGESGRHILGRPRIPGEGFDQIGLLKAVRPSRERAHGQSATDGLFDGERADPGGRAHYQERRAQLSMSS